MDPDATVFGSLLGLAAERAQGTYGDFRNREAGNDRVNELSGSLSDSVEIDGGSLAAMDAQTLVTVGYQLVLGREHEAIDEPGWSYWVGELDEGNVTAETFLAALARGAFNDDFEGELAELNDQDKAHLQERAALIPDAPRGGADAIAQDLALATDPVIASPALNEVITDLPPFIPAELGIEFTDIEPAEPEAGRPFEVTVTVEETAGIETEGLSVNLEIGDETFTPTGEIAELKGDSATVTFENLVIDDPDDYTAVVTAEAANADLVSDEQGFTVVEPDAELAIELTSIDPGEPEVDETFTVEVEVTETAGVQTDDLSVNLVIVGAGIDETITANGELSELNDGSATLTFDDLAIDDPGNYTAVVTANADNADRASDSESFDVAPKPPPEQTGLAALQEDMGAPISLLGQSDTADSFEAFNE